MYYEYMLVSTIIIGLHQLFHEKECWKAKSAKKQGKSTWNIGKVAGK